MDLSLLPRAATQTDQQTLDDLHVFHPPEVNANAAGPANPFATVLDLAQMQPEDMSAAFTIAAGGTNVCTVAIALKAGGAALTAPTMAIVWLSDDPAGTGIVGVQPSTFAVTTGSPMNSGTKTALIVQSDATGHIGVSITDTTKRHSYVAVQPLGDRVAFVSRQLLTADYG